MEIKGERICFESTPQLAFCQRMKEQKFKLTIELVPSTVWFSSLYRLYKAEGMLSKWRKIKKELLEKEGRKCWICGAEDTRLEAHEFWEYDDQRHVQKLVAIHHLCNMCHKVKHIGFWCHTPEGREGLKKAGLSRQDLISHFCKVNNCSVRDFLEHEREAFKIWQERSEYKWEQELGEFDPKR